MRFKALARRFRAIFRRNRKKAQLTGDGEQQDATLKVQDATSVVPTDPIIPISRAEMEATENNQDASIFFVRLPLEIRRLIYREIWKSYLKPRRMVPSNPGTDLRLHIYTDDSANLKTLRHTQCKVHPCDPPHEDTLYATTPWLMDTDMNPNVPAPGWFWFAWVLRIHWGKHWMCQHAVQRRWDPRTGTCKEVPKAPFLPIFLTCKKMYSEAIVSFFENVTPIFTCSRDAQRFFVEHPHPYLSSLRSVEFNFCNQNDYLYLSKVWRDSATRAAAHRLAHANEDIDDDEEDSPTMIHKVETRLFGKELWEALLSGMQQATPTLKDMEICIAGRIKKHEILTPFGYKATKEELKDEDNMIEAEEGEESSNNDKAESEEEIPSTVAPWILRGGVAVTFNPSGNVFVQHDGKMILRQDLEPEPEPEQADGDEVVVVVA